jgi:DNA-binding NarL/FixJ family response regulator
LLLEREREVAALAATIAEAAAGRARVVLVEGSAGIGKTRLLGEARRLAADAGFRLLAARGGELEREFPFGVVRQLFEPQLVDAEAREHALAGAAGAARSVFETFGDGDGGAAADPSFASLHGLYWLTVNLAAHGPLSIAVDDLHWCDGPSLRFLAYLVRRLEGLRALVIGSLRPSEPGVESALLGELAADPLTVSVQPRPLTAAAVAELVRVRLGGGADERFAAACLTTTGGNPLLLHELVKTLAAEGIAPDAAHVPAVADLGPRAASRAVLVRLARLPGEASALARAAAVLGAGADFSTVAALAGVDLSAAGAGAAALVRAEVLDPHSLAFVHPLLSAAVYHDMPVVERGLLHERAARLLADGRAPVEQVAAHLLAIPARGDGWVVEILMRAARESLQKGAADSAVSYLARAIEEPPPPVRRAHVLLELGRAESLTSGPAAVRHLGAAYEALDDPRERGMAAQVLGRALLFTGHAGEGAALARRAAAELPPELEDLRAALEAFELMAVFFGAGEPAALRRLERHRTVLAPAGVGAKMLAAVTAQEWAFSGGPSDACAELALGALAGGELIAADNALLGVTAITTLVLADREEALDAWDASLADAHGHGSLFAKSAISLWRGFTMYRRGELAEAEESLRTGFDEFELWGFGKDEALVYCAAILAAVLREQGDAAAARRALELSRDPGDRSEGARYWSSSLLELLLAEGRFEDALAVADDCAERFSYIRNPIDTPWRSPKAVALDRLGRSGEALALAAEELELARAWGAPGTVARTLRVLGTLEREAGLDRLQEAVDAAAGSPARLEHAKALAALGAALRRARRPAEARKPLRQALELAGACGARGLAEEARAELYAAGGRPRTTALRGVAALTASERRVAALAAGGETNRDIAQALFVTPKTVELHLSNAYRKLGVRSRRELPDELAHP